MISIMRSALFIVAALVPHPAAGAQDDRKPPPPVVPKPDDPGVQPEGNWYVESTGWAKNEVPVWAVVLMKPWEKKEVVVEGRNRIWYPERKAGGPWDLTFYRGPEKDRMIIKGGEPRIQGARMEVKWGYGVYGYSGGTATLQQTGIHEIRGTWKLDEDKGTEVWRRAVPRWSRLVFINNEQESGRDSQDEIVEIRPGTGPGRIVRDSEKYKWDPNDYARGNRPRCFIDVYGENLWGHHWADSAGSVDLEVEGVRYIQDDGTQTGRPPHVQGLRVTLVLWPKVAAGMHQVRLDGEPIPFELFLKRRVPSRISPGIVDPNDIPEGTGR